MNVAVFQNTLGLGGTEKAACRWARGLAGRGHTVSVMTLQEGPRKRELEMSGVPWSVVESNGEAIAQALKALSPDVIHCHAPGHPHPGDVLGAALARLPRIPVVQTNIFGRIDNPAEAAWTDFRLFISWVSCVQAARRGFRRLNEKFFARASVAIYPLDPADPPAEAEVQRFRARHGVAPDEVLFGRLSRPDPIKWTSLVIDAFCLAARRRPKLKLLLREPPPGVARQLESAPFKNQLVILPVTSDPEELNLTTAALDVALHTSLVGESFGYGIAEPMNYAKPVITNSVPTLDQAQIELVRHGECGFVASTPVSMARAILRLAEDVALRVKMGEAARSHIRRLADPDTSLIRLEAILDVARQGLQNPFAAEDLERAQATAAYLDAHQFGHSLSEQVHLRPGYYRTRAHELKRAWRARRRRITAPRPGSEVELDHP
jgi:glycosyltransferase involved in cell wall biosynthesis